MHLIETLGGARSNAGIIPNLFRLAEISVLGMEATRRDSKVRMRTFASYGPQCKTSHVSSLLIVIDEEIGWWLG